MVIEAVLLDRAVRQALPLKEGAICEQGRFASELAGRQYGS